MASFSGFDGFVEIFRGGPVTDNRGRRHDGDRLIDRAVATFDPSHHEPPACVGHPRDNAPAFGWVSELKTGDSKNGRVLMAKFKDVVPEFADLVKQGVYKKRSAAFYEDGRLRHVGFLGAAPPAIKGLADIGFDDGETIIAFGENYDRNVLVRLMRQLREWFIDRDGTETADRIVPEWQIEEMGREPSPMDPRFSAISETPTKGGSMKFSEFLDAVNIFKKMGGKDEDIDGIPTAIPPAPSTTTTEGGQFTEADLESAREDERKKVKAEFAEAEAKRQSDARKADVKTFIDSGVESGKIAPAWVKAGLTEFMESLADAAEVEFSEGEKKAPDAWFREFLEGLPKLVEFSEIATRDKDTGGKDAGAQLEQITRQKMTADKGLSYRAAFSEAQAENPDLAKEYALSING